MKKISIFFFTLILSFLIRAEAALIATQLTHTSQINAFQGNVLGAVNTIFSGQPTGGMVNGVLFEDALWGNTTVLSTGVRFWGERHGEIRTAYTGSTISGPDASVLHRITNGINFYNQNANGQLKFWNLPVNTAVKVQLITSDAAANIGNWSGVFNISTIDSVDSSVTNIGSFQAGTEPNFYDAQLATFDAWTDANGYLIIEIDQTTTQHAGIAGIAVYSSIPEPSSMILYTISLLMLGRIRFRLRKSR